MASKNFFYAKNLSDVFYQMKTISNLTIVAGCTSFVEKELPENSLSVRDIAELKIIDKHERYIDFGSAVTLSEIEDLGEANLPPTMYSAIKSIATQNIRNIATIGGNISIKDFYSTLYATLLALDARLEFQTGDEIFFQNITRFVSMPSKTLLTKVRLPLEEWEVSVFKKLSLPNKLNKLSASFVFLANSQKNQISDLRIAFAGSFKFRDIELENKLIGAHLPLSQTAISTFLLEAEDSFNKAVENENVDLILKRQFWNLVKYSLEQLT
ncbi:FAD binding domain-containing protein [uncultured Treponema sp.]|uniref:FAD binding domain-containing protein n=1 Tax=uncultured Treponema sp. TaxID=162155 RepID=UPI0025F96431|nr:FAD binding domain-containing protein [uncultured Treponema sp.]